MSEVVSEEQQEQKRGTKKKVIREDIRLQYHWYLTIFFIIYYFSWLIPVFLFFGYVNFAFLPYFLEANNFFTIFLDIKSLLSLFLMPLVIVTCYLIRLITVGIFTRIFWRITEKISPTKDGIIPRNIRSKVADYYHIRSFMIKYGKNLFTKGLFPWLAKWFFNFIGASKIGKETTIEESVGSDKFINVGKNCYVGVNSTLASHLIQGVFGNISYFEIKLGDNVTLAGMNQIGPGSSIHTDSYLLPLASTSKHSIIKGGKNYYFGIPLRKIFKRKIMEFLNLTPEDLEKNENFEEYIQKMKEEKKVKRKNKKSIQEKSIEKENNIKGTEKSKKGVKANNEQEKEETNDNYVPDEKDLTLDFTTSSAISRINIKFLAVYFPILWLAGLMVAVYWYDYTRDIENWINTLLFLPLIILAMIYIFIFGVLIFSKLILIVVNLIHKPKEGIFLAEIGDRDYEFWMLRTELKKIPFWLLRNSPLPWLDVIAFRLLGISMDFSSHLTDAWCDGEFIKIGRKVLIGQGATIMSSMVVGKYLIIKKVLFDNYVMVGGHTTIAPGTVMGQDSVIAAISSTTFGQILKPNWIYFGVPAKILKENRYAEERRDIIIKRHVDDEIKLEETHEVNIDEDKKDLIKIGDDE